VIGTIKKLVFYVVILAWNEYFVLEEFLGLKNTQKHLETPWHIRMADIEPQEPQNSSIWWDSSTPNALHFQKSTVECGKSTEKFAKMGNILFYLGRGPIAV